MSDVDPFSADGIAQIDEDDSFRQMREAVMQTVPPQRGRRLVGIVCVSLWVDEPKPAGVHTFASVWPDAHGPTAVRYAIAALAEGLQRMQGAGS